MERTRSNSKLPQPLFSWAASSTRFREAATIEDCRIGLPPAFLSTLGASLISWGSRFATYSLSCCCSKKTITMSSSSGSSSSRVRARPPPTFVDSTLGAFSNVAPNPTLDHLIRYLSTWSGTDKALMLTQYGSKLVIPLLTIQHSLRLRLAGNKSYHAYKGGSANARRLEKLSALIGDARVLFRIWGVLPMIKWVSSHAVTVRVPKWTS